MNKGEFRVSAGVCVAHEGKILMVREAKPSRYGMWGLPSGHVEMNENVFDAAIRECKEETGFDVKLTGLVGIQNLVNRTDGNHYVCFFFSATVLGGEKSFDPAEIMTVQYLDPVDILSMPVGNVRGRQQEIVKQFLKGHPAPLDCIGSYSMTR